MHMSFFKLMSTVRTFVVQGRTRDDNAGVAGLALHLLVSGVCDGKHMGGPLKDLAALVVSHLVRAVDVERPVWVDRDAHLADVRVHAACIEPAHARQIRALMSLTHKHFAKDKKNKYKAADSWTTSLLDFIRETGLYDHVSFDAIR